jgi:hypothetical protein
MTGVMAIKPVSIEVRRSGSMLRSSSCVPHGGLADTLRLQVSLAELRTFPGGPMTHHGRWSTS